MINFLFLIIGFFPLIIGANLLVDSASSIAKRFNIPNIAIGLTVVSFGTSAPELVVNLFGSLSNSPGIALGNVLGSNIFNLMVILGISAIIFPLTVKTNTTWIEVPLCLLASIILIITANDKIFEARTYSEISFIDGFILLIFFILFMIYNVQLMKKGKFEENLEIKKYSFKKSIIYVIAGIILLVAGGRIIVEFSLNLANNIEISERIIALTIISIGTSLPELATSAVAASKHNVDIAVGNIVGSNIFNSFFVLGISAVIRPLYLQKYTNYDLLLNIIASFLIFVFIFTGRGRKIERYEGLILLFIYFSYIVFLMLNINL